MRPRSSSLFALLLSLLPVACALSAGSSGLSVDDRGGRLFVDGKALDHHREVALQGQLASGAEIVLTSHTGIIDVVGVPGDRFELVVDVYSEIEGDGEVELQGGRLVADDGDGRCVVNGIRGRLPEGVQLRVENSTGDVVLTSFTGDRSFRVDVGTGPVQIVSCKFARLDVDAATSSVRLQGCRIERSAVDSGTGAFLAEECDLASFEGQSGTSDFRFRASRIGRAIVTSGTGDLVLLGTPVSELHASLGTGEIVDQPLAGTAVAENAQH